MNCVRKHLSRIKGGKLAAAVYPARLITLSISDVPGDNPDAIGSGPTVGDGTTLADARAVIAQYGIKVSDEIARALADPANETLKPGDPKLSSAEYRIVAAPKASIAAGAEVAKAAGYAIEVLGTRWKARRAMSAVSTRRARWPRSNAANAWRSCLAANSPSPSRVTAPAVPTRNTRWA